MRQSTPQEAFWAGEFGSGYIDRNRSDELLASNCAFFEGALRNAGAVSSCIEFGANVGMNMKALQSLYPGIDARGIEINGDAAAELRKVIGPENVFEGSMFDWTGEPAQLSFTKGVLIHINPDMLRAAYDRLHAASSQFILVAEYYNPAPVAILTGGTRIAFSSGISRAKCSSCIPTFCWSTTALSIAATRSSRRTTSPGSC